MNLHIITDLDGFGGAESTLFRYLSETSTGVDKQTVFVLKRIGVDTIGSKIKGLGVDVREFDISFSFSGCLRLFSLLKEVKKTNSKVINCWLYHPCFVSVLFKLLTNRSKLVWHIRSLPFCSLGSNPVRYIIQRILACFSHVPDLIISNSNKSMIEHRQLGFHTENWHIVPNGVNATLYKGCSLIRDTYRNEFGFSNEDIVIISVGRNVPEKGYVDYVKSINLLMKLNSKLRFVICGNEVDLNISPFNVIEDTVKVFCLGKRNDIPELLNMSDLFVLPSISESFPNALVEAMAAGLVCFSSDVGDVTDILGKEFIFNKHDIDDICKKICRYSTISYDERNIISKNNIDIISTTYSITAMSRKLDDLIL